MDILTCLIAVLAVSAFIIGITLMFDESECDNRQVKKQKELDETFVKMVQKRAQQ